MTAFRSFALREAMRMFDYYRETDELAVLVQAIGLFRIAVTDIPVGDPEREFALAKTVVASEALAERTGDLTARREAIDAMRELVATAGPGHPGLPVYLTELGNTLLRLFEQTGEFTALTEAVDVCRKALATAGHHPSRAWITSALAQVLHVQFKETRDRAVLQEAVALHRAAAKIAEGPDRAGVLSTFCGALQSMFLLTEDAPTLVEAIEVGRQAVAVASPENPDLARYVSNLGGALAQRFTRTRELPVLAEAVDAYREALSRSPDSDRAGHLENLGLVLQRQAEWVGDPALLSEAIAVSREAVAVLPSGHPDRTHLLSGLGIALLLGFQKTDDQAMLEEAMEVSRAATIDDSGPRRAMHLGNFGVVLQRRWQYTGDPAVLDELVDTMLNAVAVSPANDHHRATFLANLGSALRARFEWTGDLVSLKENARVCREAVAINTADHYYFAGRLQELGLCLMRLFERTGDPTVLDELVHVCRRAVKATSANHPDRAVLLSGLTISLRMSAESTGDRAVLTEAVEVARQAVALTPIPHPDRGPGLANLANALTESYLRTQDVSVLREWIAVSREAVAVTAPDHFTRAASLNSLGYALTRWFDRTDDHSALQEAIDCFAMVGTVPSAPVSERVRTAHAAAELALRAGDHERALRLVGTAVDLLPILADRQLRRADREHQMTGTAGLASTAAAVAISVGHPRRAVELLEQTRGVLIGNALDLRGDLTELRAHAPGLADEFLALQQESAYLDQAPTGDLADVDVPTSRLRDKTAQDHRVLTRKRAELGDRLTGLLDRIRALPGFDRFLRPPSIDLLRSQAALGPIIYLTTHRIAGGHALIVVDDPADPVRVVPLPGLTKDLCRSVDTALLGTLWDTVAGPVLTELGFTASPKPGEPWPRIWWCPVGVLASLPLHAAGHHSASDGRTVVDRVISSYTPTIRALAHARASDATQVGASMLIVAVPNPMGAAPLPGVAREVERLRHLVPTATVLCEGATPAAVTAALTRYRVAHFACHGLVDQSLPANSHLLLHDHDGEPLTVAAVSRLDLRQADLAYLSACSTTHTTVRHADEATHITAAFHLAGYRAVVGTLWPVNDAAAAGVTRDFYRHLTRQGTEMCDPALAAVALHHAVRRCRDRYPVHPALWAAYLHTGV